MENKSKNAIIFGVIIFLLLLLSGILFFNGKSNKKKLKIETQQNLSLASESEGLKNELKAIQKEFSDRNVQVDDIIAEKERMIAENNARIQRLVVENRSGNSAKNQIKEIESQNSVLQSEIKGLKEQLFNLSEQTKDQSGKISDLENQNNALKKQNELLRSLISDNIRISATKGKKNKLTVMAARTNMISAKLDIPVSIGDNISFTIVYPDGSSISSKNEPSASVNVSAINATKENERFAAGYQDETKTLDLKYIPKSKLAKGMYKLSVYHDDIYLTGVYIGFK